MMRKIKCRHCGLEIEYLYHLDRWLHIQSDSLFCGPDGKLLAEPL